MNYLLITNNSEIGSYLIKNGVSRIFIDLESLGKMQRQKDRDTWKTNHVMEDIKNMKGKIKSKKLLVRLNPWNLNSKDEINIAIKYGADYLMLPMIKKISDIRNFCEVVRYRVPVVPLIETRESLLFLDEIIKIESINEIYIGLNDLAISCGYKFIFEPLINGMLDNASILLNKNTIKWGFGGIAKIGEGLLPAEYILGEHVRLKSTNVILSRSFHGGAKELSKLINQANIKKEIEKLNIVYKKWLISSEEELLNNHLKVKNIIKEYIDNS